MAKKKIVKLTDEQYIEYIMSLKDETSAQSAKNEKHSPDSSGISTSEKSGK